VIVGADLSRLDLDSQNRARVTDELELSAAFVPVLFLVCSAFAYEDAFLVVSFKSDNRHLSRWKKVRLLLRFGFNLPALQAFRRSPAIHRYAWLKSKEEARAVLKSWSGSVDDSLLEGA